MHFTDNIVFGSLSVSLSAGPAAISPRLPFAEPGAILEEGEPNLMSALRWEYGLTATLRGREDDLAALLRWSEGGGNTVSVRLVSGPGGSGKTRLAAEAALLLRQRGWCAGFLPHGASHGQVIDASGRAGGGLFLVIDYPEERPQLIEELFEHIADLANPPIPIRFLLVSRRSLDDWRRQADLLGGRFGRQQLAAQGPLEPADALAVLGEAAETFAQLIDAPRPPLDGAATWLGRDPTHRLALMSLTAGIHAALTGSGDFALGAPELMREIARRELRRVRRASRMSGLGEYGLERLLGAALMNAEGLDAERVQALGVLDIAPGLAGQALLDAVALTPWWGPAPLGGRRLIRLEPDRPAAAFLEATLLADPQPRLQDWLYAASAGTGRAFGPMLSRLVWDLTELSTDGRGAAPLERALLAMLDRAPERAESFLAIGVEHSTAFSGAFAARVLEQALSGIQAPELRATVLNSLANVLSQLGRDEQALAAASEGVALRRSLAAARSGAFAAELATSLTNQSRCLSKRGRREEALAAADEAVDLFRPLAAANPETFAPYLAGSLNNLSSCLAGLHRSEQALNAVSEAIELYRRLSAAAPEAFTPDLAASLNNQATRLSELWKVEEALAAAAEAVDNFRQLADARPDAFTHELAGSLSNLANRLFELGKSEEALAAASEAVSLRRRLAAARTETFTPDLAGSLNNLANRLSGLGRSEGALAAATEAVNLYRPLSAAAPEIFKPDLAMSLTNLARCLADLGKPEEALAVNIEAVALSRELVAGRPETYTPGLAGSLNNLANRLSALGRREDALAAASEAVDHFRLLAAERPEAFAADLAGSLANRADRLSALGRREEALATASEALESLVPYFVAQPVVFGSRMKVVLEGYLVACDAAQTEPSDELLGPILAALDPTLRGRG